MSDSTDIKTLFPETPISGNPAGILDSLSAESRRSLAYGGDLGCNPGYIFRGELDYDVPLQTSLERGLNGDQLRATEARLYSEFVEGDGRRVAEIIDGQNSSRHSQPASDVFWWLSLMQHYGHPTRLIDFTRDIRLAAFFAVEHWRNESKCRECCKHSTVDKDLMIYCFPCKDPDHPTDPDNNKSPIEPNRDGKINTNDALGKQMGLEVFKGSDVGNTRQKYGWDRSFYENPRLKCQKGMFVNPYEYPGDSRQDTSDSWLVQNLTRNDTHQYAKDCQPKRIRIPFKYAEGLEEFLKSKLHLTPATVYLDYARVKLEM